MRDSDLTGASEWRVGMMSSSALMIALLLSIKDSLKCSSFYNDFSIIISKTSSCCYKLLLHVLLILRMLHITQQYYLRLAS